MKTDIPVTNAAGNPRLPIPRLLSIVDGEILRRAGVIALVIGGALTLVNQPGAVFGGEPFDYLQLSLVFLLPFVVVTISQTLGARRAMLDARQNGDRGLGDETVLATVLSHGIPLRALAVGILAGSVNVSIGITSTLLEGGSVASMPVAPLAQAYVLPILFGLLSQTIAYRRAIQTERRMYSWIR